MTPFLLAMVLIGTIADQQAPVAVFSVTGQDESRAVGLGGQIDGWTVTRVEPKRVTLQQGGRVQEVAVGQAPVALELIQAVKATGNQVIISSELKGKLEGADLARTMMQTCSEAVTGPDGATVGYKLFEIDEGSIFQVVGFSDGDVVTEIDGKPLDSPLNAMSALMEVKKKNRFTVGYLRGGVSKTMQVSVQ